ncbi:membrane protein [Trypanosoma rangeli]|uniref:Membrane protein n=1 Tax=Trypanosoma rangeli TaxID=5698 RepID=A0A3R7N4G9_TRYRA|nr:uncharacterized protein TraAM80_07887 [Trypanosoma rangeli]RNE99988.1 membrane protein [Trypanosoma rangeli]|eukprot:RNE99988.1 membrane protein [Trypanosoma rangeli]
MVGLSLRLDIKFSNFNEFYIYYLSKHMHQWTRRGHVAGTMLAAVLLLLSLVKRGSVACAVGAPILGYGVAWASDVAVEGITPTSFNHPWWSFLANMKLVKDVLCSKQTV